MTVRRGRYFRIEYDPSPGGGSRRVIVRTGRRVCPGVWHVEGADPRVHGRRYGSRSRVVHAIVDAIADRYGHPEQVWTICQTGTIIRRVPDRHPDGPDGSVIAVCVDSL